MKTMKIRELRGSTLEEYSGAGELVGLTRDRALIAVVVPVVQAWVEHMIDQNWSRVMQSVARGEMDMTREADMVTLDDVLDEAAGRDAAARDAAAPEPESELPRHRKPVKHLRAARRVGADAASSSVQHLATEAGKATAALIGTPAVEMFKRLAAAITMAEPGKPSITSSTTVRIGDLSARRIEQAGDDRELLILTNDRALIGIVVPVSQRLVEFLVSQNLSRVMYNIQLAEEQAAAGEPLLTLDEVLSHQPGEELSQSRRSRPR